MVSIRLKLKGKYVVIDQTDAKALVAMAKRGYYKRMRKAPRPHKTAKGYYDSHGWWRSDRKYKPTRYWRNGRWHYPKR